MGNYNSNSGVKSSCGRYLEDWIATEKDGQTIYVNKLSREEYSLTKKQINKDQMQLFYYRQIYSFPNTPRVTILQMLTQSQIFVQNASNKIQKLLIDNKNADQKNLSILKLILETLSYLVGKYGNFYLTESMIRLDNNFKVIIWINQNFHANSPQYPLPFGEGEYVMISNLARIFHPYLSNKDLLTNITQIDKALQKTNEAMRRESIYHLKSDYNLKSDTTLKNTTKLIQSPPNSSLYFGHISTRTPTIIRKHLSQTDIKYLIQKRQKNQHFKERKTLNNNHQIVFKHHEPSDTLNLSPSQGPSQEIYHEQSEPHQQFFSFNQISTRSSRRQFVPLSQKQMRKDKYKQLFLKEPMDFKKSKNVTYQIKEYQPKSHNDYHSQKFIGLKCSKKNNLLKDEISKQFNKVFDA